MYKVFFPLDKKGIIQQIVNFRTTIPVDLFTLDVDASKMMVMGNDMNKYHKNHPYASIQNRELANRF